MDGKMAPILPLNQKKKKKNRKRKRNRLCVPPPPFPFPPPLVLCIFPHAAGLHLRKLPCSPPPHPPRYTRQTMRCALVRLFFTPWNKPFTSLRARHDSKNIKPRRKDRSNGKRRTQRNAERVCRFKRAFSSVRSNAY